MLGGQIRRKAAVPVIGAAALLVVAFAGCDGWRFWRSNPPPNIVFIMIDTLRADRLGVYGGTGGHSPTVDAIAAEGVVFERAVAPAPWTQPSIASLFCGCYPGVHQVLKYDLAMAGSYRGAPKVRVFDDSFDTLAEGLRSKGYATAAFVANPFILSEYGFGQGFDHFDASFAANTTPGRVVNDAAVTWLAQRDVDRPFFIYLHYMDVHGPYEAGPEFLDPLLDALERSTDLHALGPSELQSLPAYLRRLPRHHTNAERHRRLARYREYWDARYDAGVREIDHHLAHLRARLDQMGLWRPSYVVLTSDHGESLSEHGVWEHGLSVYHRELHVPLILRWPGMLRAGTRVGDLVRLIDVLPTIGDQLGIDLDGPVQGRTAVPLLAGGTDSEPRAALVEGIKIGPEQQALYSEGWKLIGVPGAGGRHLYQAFDDPWEREDLAAQHPEVVARLGGMLEETVRENRRLAGEGPVEKATLSPEQYERLRALGYAP